MLILILILILILLRIESITNKCYANSSENHCLSDRNRDF